jgi:hypothetical protein
MFFEIFRNICTIYNHNIREFGKFLCPSLTLATTVTFTAESLMIFNDDAGTTLVAAGGAATATPTTQTII